MKETKINKKNKRQIKIRGYDKKKKNKIKQQQEKQLQECLPNTCKNPPVTLHEVCKNLSKISRTSLIHGHFHIATKCTRSSCCNMSWKVWMSFIGIFA